MPSIVDKSSVTKICVDDFAIRKRFSYETVMVDLESHRIIDLLPSRETSDVAKWLATFPDIQVVSRDGLPFIHQQRPIRIRKPHRSVTGSI